MANDKTPFEIPEELRNFADQSIDHARKAFDGYIEQGRKAVSGFEEAASQVRSESAGTQDHIFDFAEKNVSAALDYARQMVNAESPQDLVEIQKAFVESQMNALAEQSGEMADMARNAMESLAETAKKATE